MAHPIILFDLDNTLYPASSGVLQEMNRRIRSFVAGYFNVNEDEAEVMRQGKAALFGTTLQWLRVCHKLMDPEPYIEAIHPVNIEDFVAPNPELRSFIAELPWNYVLFTNSPLEHAERTLTALNLLEFFPRIWDLRRLGYRGKPHREAYYRILGDLGLSPREALLVDDNSLNIQEFHKLGGGVLLVQDDPPSRWMGALTQIMGA